MFCKWCGATVIPAEGKCQRCGKTIPTLSDCGGFYDLVPAAPRLAESGHETETIHVPEPPTGPKEEPPRHRPEKERPPKSRPHRSIPKKRKCFLLTPMLCGVLISAVAVSSIWQWQMEKVSSSADRQEQMNQALESQIEVLEAQMRELQKALPTEPEPTQGTLPPETQPEEELGASLGWQSVTFWVKTNLGEDEKTYRTVYELDSEKNNVRVEWHCGSSCAENGEELEETNDWVDLTFCPVSEEQSCSITVTYDAGASFEAAREVQWQYRVGTEEEWQDALEDGFVQSSDTGYASLTVQDILALTGEGETLTLRCQIRLEDAEGNAVMLTIEGTAEQNIL